MISAALVAVMMLSGVQASAATATKKVVLQISDGGPDKQELVLNVANNLLKMFDDIQVEIVAFGPGLRLLLADNDNKGRIQALSASGVKFAACGNTIKKMSKALGHEPAINSNAVRIEAGIGRILELVGQGYVLVRP